MAGYVNHLDTKSFAETIAAFSGYISDFEGIVSGVRDIYKEMLGSWEGEGRRAFEKDCNQVQLNLKDLSDVMYELRDALIDAQVKFVEKDAAVSKAFDS